MKFHLTTKAKKDLIKIARYTEENWGVKQRNSYLEQIDSVFHLVAESPKRGLACDEIREGYRKFSVGKHIVFYRQFSAKEIQIVRILHASMDIENHLLAH